MLITKLNEWDIDFLSKIILIVWEPDWLSNTTASLNEIWDPFWLNLSYIYSFRSLNDSMLIEWGLILVEWDLDWLSDIIDWLSDIIDWLSDIIVWLMIS